MYPTIQLVHGVYKPTNITQGAPPKVCVLFSSALRIFGSFAMASPVKVERSAAAAEAVAGHEDFAAEARGTRLKNTRGMIWNV